MSDGHMVGSEWCGGVGTDMFRGVAPLCGRWRAHRRPQEQRLRVLVFLGCHLVKIMPAMVPMPASDDRKSNEQACHVLSTVAVDALFWACHCSC